MLTLLFSQQNTENSITDIGDCQGNIERGSDKQQGISYRQNL